MRQGILLFIVLLFTFSCCGENDTMSNPYGGIAPGGARDISQQVGLGNILPFVAADERLGLPPVVQPKTILNVNLTDYEEGRKDVLKPGSWVLTFQTSDVVQQAGTRLNNLVADIKYGSGAARARVEVTVAPGASVQISADYVRVDVSLEPFFNGIGVAGTTGTPPASQRLSAFLRRGTIVSYPTRSVFIGTVGAGATVLGNLPPLALDFYGLAGSQASLFYAATTTVDFGNNAQNWFSYTGPDMLASVLSGSALVVPKGATEFRITNLGAVAIQRVTLEFGLDL